MSIHVSYAGQDAVNSEFTFESATGGTQIDQVVDTEPGGFFDVRRG